MIFFILQSANKIHSVKTLFCQASIKNTRQSSNGRAAHPTAVTRPPHVQRTCLYFAECPCLPSVSVQFAECFLLGTRQSWVLPSAICLPSVEFKTLSKQDICRVPDGMHSANPHALGNFTVSGSDSTSGDSKIGLFQLILMISDLTRNQKGDIIVLSTVKTLRLSNWGTIMSCDVRDTVL